MRTAPRDSLIIALDAGSDETIRLAERLVGRVRFMKVGMTLFYSEGPACVERLLALGYEVFVDLKLHDIPHQVAGAARELGRLGISMFTVHASGGAEMIRAAVEGSAEGAAEAGVQVPAVLGVTVLTSMDDTALSTIGVPRPAAEQVLLLAQVTRDGGAHGVVCSPREAEGMRGVLGSAGLVVTPGIRPSWAAAADQVRIATPAAALSAGASHLVIGRPITASSDPAGAVERIVEEMEKGSSL